MDKQKEESPPEESTEEPPTEQSTQEQKEESPPEQSTEEQKEEPETQEQKEESPPEQSTEEQKEEPESQEDKEENPPDKKEQKTKSSIQNKQIIWAVVLMISMILIIFLVPYIKQNYFDKFTYMKLEFQKTQLGDLIFYSTSIPVTNSEGTEVTGEYTMPYNRYDPRKLDYIEVNTPYEKIMFKKNNQTVFITLDPSMNPCPDNTIALSNLAGFLRDFAKYEIQTAVSDEEYSNASEMDHVTCDTHPDSTTISITSGTNTTIRKRGGNCYILTYSNCEILPLTEKFIWTILEDYMKSFTKKE